VVTLVNFGCDLNAQTADGTTPLHAAMYTKNALLFEQLAKLGADPDVKGGEGLTVRQQCADNYQ